MFDVKIAVLVILGFTAIAAITPMMARVAPPVGGQAEASPIIQIASDVVELHERMLPTYKAFNDWSYGPPDRNRDFILLSLTYLTLLYEQNKQILDNQKQILLLLEKK